MLPTVCVDLPAFPLQLLFEDHPSWVGVPAGVVADDKPHAKLLRVNDSAMRLGIMPGMRYAAALSLCGSLHAGVVSADRVARGVEDVARTLQDVAPLVEPDREVPGVFFVDARGLGRLYTGPADLGRCLLESVREAGFAARVVLGSTRFGTRAVARGEGRGNLVVLPTRDIEQAAARRIPLARLEVAPRLREGLRKLGIGTLGAVMDLPAEGLRSRFGDEAWELHAQARGLLDEPFEPLPLSEPLRQGVDLEWPETDSGRLLQGVEALLDPLLARLRETEGLASELMISCVQDDGRKKELAIRPARPTTTSEVLMELVRLRFERMTFRSGVVELGVELAAVRATMGQESLFAEKPRRDLDSLARALARVRAELGSDAVVRAELRDAHLPEATFAWRPMDRPCAACVQTRPERRLVRRILARPRPAGACPQSYRVRDDGWRMLGATSGGIVDLKGPFFISGGWWRREVTRAYHWVTTDDGRLLWAYHDQRRRRWFVQGELQ